MESWMISLGIAITAVIGSAYVNRYQISETKKKVDVHDDRLEKHGDNLVELNTKSSLAMTSDDVDKIIEARELINNLEVTNG